MSVIPVRVYPVHVSWKKINKIASRVKKGLNVSDRNLCGITE